MKTVTISQFQEIMAKAKEEEETLEKYIYRNQFLYFYPDGRAYWCQCNWMFDSIEEATKQIDEEENEAIKKQIELYKGWIEDKDDAGFWELMGQKKPSKEYCQQVIDLGHKFLSQDKFELKKVLEFLK